MTDFENGNGLNSNGQDSDGDSGTAGIVPYVLLEDGNSVPVEFMEKMEQHILCKAKTAAPEVAYTLKQLCGKEFWKKLTREESRLAGRCMVHLVKQNKVPFDHVPRDFFHPTPRRYFLK